MLEIETLDKAPSMDTEVPSLTCFEKGSIINEADDMPTLPAFPKAPPGLDKTSMSKLWHPFD